MGEKNRYFMRGPGSKNCQLTGSHYYPEFTFKETTCHHGMLDKIFQVSYHLECYGCVACDTTVFCGHFTINLHALPPGLKGNLPFNQQAPIQIVDLCYMSRFRTFQQAGYPLKKSKLLIETVNSRVLCTEKRGLTI